MQKQITKRQKELLVVLYQYIENTGYPPTFNDMREDLGVSSNQSVIDLLRKLIDHKMIRKTESQARGISILPLGYEALEKPPLAPYLGATTAGLPAEAVSLEGDWVGVPSVHDNLERLNDEVFVLKVNGDSMINAGISDGDNVLIQKKKEFVTREIVLAYVGEDATIKRFISTDKPPYLFLQPENPKYERLLFTDDTRLDGKVISVRKGLNWVPIN